MPGTVSGLKWSWRDGVPERSRDEAGWVCEPKDAGEMHKTS